MLVSVIVPVYNVEKFLPNCIESIIGQTYSNFELILVDDGSPDSSGSICDKYAESNSKIRVVHQNNAGLSAARNAGIEIAKGDYLTFVDSDDFVLPHFLEVLVKGCEDNQADLSVCAYTRCFFNDSVKSIPEKDVIESYECFSNDKMKVFLTTKKIRTSAWGKMYKKFLFDNLRFPIGKYNEDEFTTYLTIHLANKIVVSDYKGYVYRFNDNSIMNEAFSPKKMHGVEGCLERMRFIEKEYPKLKKFGYRAVVYACNQVLLSMSHSKTIDVSILKQLQPLYRKYAFYYVITQSALLGKIFALLSFINVRIGLNLVRCLR